MKGLHLKILLLTICLFLSFVFFFSLNNLSAGHSTEKLVGHNISVAAIGDDLWYKKPRYIDQNKRIGLYFLASWCATCLHEYQNFSTENSDIQWVAVLYFDDIDNALEKFPNLENKFTGIIDDKQGMFSLDWGVKGTPEILVFGEGRLLHRYYRISEIR